MEKLLEKLNKLSLPVVIIIASLILGGFYYASQVNKQQSIERQQEIKLQLEDLKLKQEWSMELYLKQLQNIIEREDRVIFVQVEQEEEEIQVEELQEQVLEEDVTRESEIELIEFVEKEKESDEKFKEIEESYKKMIEEIDNPKLHD